MYRKEESSSYSRHQTDYSRWNDESNQVPLRYNLGTALCSWLVLTACVMLPGTFTSIQKSTDLGQTESGKAVQSAIKNVHLLGLSAGLSLLGLVGLGAIRWHMIRKYGSNPIWDIRSIYW